MQCGTMWCGAMRCGAVRYGTVWYTVLGHGAVRCRYTVRCVAMRYGAEGAVGGEQEGLAAPALARRGRRLSGSPLPAEGMGRDVKGAGWDARCGLGRVCEWGV